MPKVKITKAPTGSQADYGLVRKSNVPQTGDSDRKVKNTMTALEGEDRAKANIEVEGGETVLGDVNRDGYVELFEFKGKRHSNGGMDVDIPEGSFIFSDTSKLKIKDKEMLKQYFGLSSKRGGYTPAEISKKFQINEFIDTLKNPESDEMAKRSANEMIKNNMQKLGLLAFVQESIKGFPDGVPDIAQMALQELGVDPNQILQEAAPQQQGEMPPQQEMMNQEQMPMAMYGKQVRYPDGGGLPTPNQSKDSFDKYYHHLYDRLNKVYGQDFLASKPPGVDQGTYDLISNLLVWQDDRVIPNDPKMGQMVAAIKNSTMLPDDEIKTILSYNISQPLGMGDKFSLWRNLSGDTIDRFEDFKGYVKGKRGEGFTFQDGGTNPLMRFLPKAQPGTEVSFSEKLNQRLGQAMGNVANDVVRQVGSSIANTADYGNTTQGQLYGVDQNTQQPTPTPKTRQQLWMEFDKKWKLENDGYTDGLDDQFTKDAEFEDYAKAYLNSLNQSPNPSEEAIVVPAKARGGQLPSYQTAGGVNATPIGGSGYGNTTSGYLWDMNQGHQGYSDTTPGYLWDMNQNPSTEPKLNPETGLMEYIDPETGQTMVYNPEPVDRYFDSSIGAKSGSTSFDPIKGFQRYGGMTNPLAKFVGGGQRFEAGPVYPSQGGYGGRGRNELIMMQNGGVQLPQYQDAGTVKKADVGDTYYINNEPYTVTERYNYGALGLGGEWIVFDKPLKGFIRNSYYGTEGDDNVSDINYIEAEDFDKMISNAKSNDNTYQMGYDVGNFGYGNRWAPVEELSYWDKANIFEMAADASLVGSLRNRGEGNASTMWTVTDHKIDNANFDRQGLRKDTKKTSIKTTLKGGKEFEVPTEVITPGYEIKRGNKTYEVVEDPMGYNPRGDDGINEGKIVRLRQTKDPDVTPGSFFDTYGGDVTVDLNEYLGEWVNDGQGIASYLKDSQESRSNRDYVMIGNTSYYKVDGADSVFEYYPNGSETAKKVTDPLTVDKIKKAFAEKDKENVKTTPASGRTNQGATTTTRSTPTTVKRKGPITITYD